MIEDREKQIDNINQQISDCKEYDCVSRQKHKNLCETSKVIEVILANGHISDAHIRMLVKQDKVKYIRCGQGARGKILVSKESLLKYLGAVCA